MSIFPACKPFKYQPFNSFFMMSETSEDTVKRQRKPNWSQDQLLLLTQFVLERRGNIKGKFGSGVTSKKELGGMGRNLPQCSQQCVAPLRIARSVGMPCNHRVGSRLQTLKEPSRLQVCPLVTLLAFIWDMDFTRNVSSDECCSTRD